MEQTIKPNTGMRATDSTIEDSAARNSQLAQEKAFSVLVKHSVHQAIGNALGQSVLEILLSTGLLDDATSPKDFHEQLVPIFGNGATVLEKLIVKELYRDLNIPYEIQGRFEYEEALRTARDMLFVESRLR